MKRVSSLTRTKIKREQDGECVYCGKKILPFARVSLCYDGNGVAHTRCAELGRNF